MRFYTPSDFFLLAFLISCIIILGNLQTTFALTPVADLTGEWSGFAQLSDIDGYCEITGKVNAIITQNDADIDGRFSFVTTHVKSNLEGLNCEFEPFERDIRGTLDGSRITLYSDDATFEGWYASSGIKLDITSDWFSGTTQLSPTNFTPPQYSPKNEDAENEEDTGEEDTGEEDTGEEDTGEEDTGDEFAEEEDSAEKDKSLDDIKNEPTSKDWAESENISQNEEKMKLVDIKDDVIDLLKLGKFDKALLLLDKILENNPDDIFALHNKAVILGHLDRNIEALSYINKALEIDPNDLDTRQAQKDILTNIKTGSQISVEPVETQVEAKSIFTVGGDRGKICNWILNKANPCRDLDGKLKPGDEIQTGTNNLAVITLDDGKSTIYLGPNSSLGVLQISEKLRLFYLPSTGSMKAEIHDKPGVTTKFGMCTGKPEKCLLEDVRYWAWIEGTELMIERHVGEDTKLTVLEGHVGVLKGDEQTTTVTVDTNNQLVFKNNISPDTTITPINSESIDRWWIAAVQSEQPKTSSPQNGGCLIATAAFGSELAPQVQMLRDTRDNIVMQTKSGAAFMTGFNSVYYSFAPTVTDWEIQHPIFKEIVRTTITPLITTLSILNYVDIDSESKMITYGIGVILLNIGMYFIVPAFVVMKLKKWLKC